MKGVYKGMEDLYAAQKREQDEAAAAARAAEDGRPHVHVLTIEVDDVLIIDEDGQDGTMGASWVSVHRTRAGAESRLREKCAEWGLLDLLERDQVTHGISHLPVEN